MRGMAKHADQALAIRRTKLTRYLALVDFPLFTQQQETYVLQALVMGLHRQRLKRFGRLSNAWPLTPSKVEELARENHYVNQLVAVKQMWGRQAKIGIVDFDGTVVECRTVADLVRCGCAPARLAYLDAYLHTLPPLHERRAPTPWLRKGC